MQWSFMDAQCHYIGTLARPLPIYVVPYLFGLFGCLKLKKKAVLVGKSYDKNSLFQTRPYLDQKWMDISESSLFKVSCKYPGKRRRKKKKKKVSWIIKCIERKKYRNSSSLRALKKIKINSLQKAFLMNFFMPTFGSPSLFFLLISTICLPSLKTDFLQTT